MERNKEIDVLKFIGLMCIVLAHVNIDNGIIFQIRNFDVVLLVLVSGYFSCDSYKRSKNLREFYKKRILRLLVPTYVYITFFFIITYYINNCKMMYNLKDIICTYLLTGGIGYVWIIKVYLIIAFMVPILIWIKIKLDKINIIKY